MSIYTCPVEPFIISPQDKLLREVVDFLCSHTLSVPAEALSLYRKLARLPQRYPTACVSATAVTESLRRLSTMGAINLEEVAVGSRKVLMLVGIKRNVLRSLAEEHASCGQTNTSTCADGDAQVYSAAAAAVGSLSRSAMPRSPSEAVSTTVVSRAIGSPPPKHDVSVAQPLVPQPESKSSTHLSCQLTSVCGPVGLSKFTPFKTY